MKYTNVDDHGNLEKFADMVTINHRKVYTAPELANQAALLANAVQDKEQIELNKKAAMSEFKNQLDSATSNIKKLSSRVANGFEYADIPVSMYLDPVNKRRVYFDPHSGNFVADEEFKASDYQRQIDFEAEEEKEKVADIKRQQMMEENNSAGYFSENGFYTDHNGNLTDIPPAAPDALDKVIDGKIKGAKVKKEKPAPKDNLGEHYGKNHEVEDELPEDDLFAPEGGDDLPE